MTAPRMVAWRDVEAGSLVRLRGGDWRVERVKVKGKAARVRVSGPAGTFERELKAKDRVELIDGHAEGGPLRDERGAQRRWATRDELVREAPGVLKGTRWDEPQADPAGAAVEGILGARLVAETPDEAAGYFVPVVDVTNVRTHLWLFHGIRPLEQPADEGRALEVHKIEHDRIESESLTEAEIDELVARFRNHWHSKRRPGALVSLIAKAKGASS